MGKLNWKLLTKKRAGRRSMGSEMPIRALLSEIMQFADQPRPYPA